VLRYVLDTGALISAERGDRWVMRFFALRHRGQARLSIPMVCVLEWWRSRTTVREAILRTADVEPLTLAIAQAAGQAQAKIAGATAIDAAVMATAAVRGGIVVTRDVRDFERLREHFRAVRVFGHDD
jgi:predicted nucleic acid-binding protein